MTPAELATELDVSVETIRRHPGRLFPRRAGERRRRWVLTSSQVRAVAESLGREPRAATPRNPVGLSQSLGDVFEALQVPMPSLSEALEDLQVPMPSLSDAFKDLPVPMPSLSDAFKDLPVPMPSLTEAFMDFPASMPSFGDLVKDLRMPMPSLTEALTDFPVSMPSFGDLVKDLRMPTTSDLFRSLDITGFSAVIDQLGSDLSLRGVDAEDWLALKDQFGSVATEVQAGRTTRFTRAQVVIVMASYLVWAYAILLWVNRNAPDHADGVAMLATVLLGAVYKQIAGPLPLTRAQPKGSQGRNP